MGLFEVFLGRYVVFNLYSKYIILVKDKKINKYKYYLGNFLSNVGL